jgi:hypothetical protein
MMAEAVQAGQRRAGRPDESNAGKPDCSYLLRLQQGPSTFFIPPFAKAANHLAQ